MIVSEGERGTRDEVVPSASEVKTRLCREHARERATDQRGRPVMTYENSI